MIQCEQIGAIRKYRLARSNLGRVLYFTACYWIDGLIVDTGCAHTIDELVAALDGLPINCIVNTHSHEDNIAANAALQAKYGVKALAHPLALPVLLAPREKQPLQLYRRIMWDYFAPSRGSALGNTVETEHHRFEVIYTPEHSPDHICLYEREKGWIFTGDAYIGGKDRALRQDYDIWQIIKSLKKIAQLNPVLLFPGSGSVRKHPREEILEKIEYLEEMGHRVLTLHAEGLSHRQISRRLFGRELPIAYFTLGHFSGKNLVRSYAMNRGGNHV
jgi:glyoxylase-like metal-dependent hydrolase (beta-lactamase superfamily II)